MNGLKMFWRSTLLCLLMIAVPIQFAHAEELAALTDSDRFQQIGYYDESVFVDIQESIWYSVPVKTVYEYGIMTGTGTATFSPAASITLAEVITIAARLNSIYLDTTIPMDSQPSDPWYWPYLSYAKANNILNGRMSLDYEKPASREMVAYLLANALPPEEYDSLTPTDAPPDVTDSNPFYSFIKKLYQAGILQGSDNDGNFEPFRTITRAETSAIVARMVQTELRRTVNEASWITFTDLEPVMEVYSWNYDGRRWSMEVQIPQDAYEKYRSFDRSSIYGYRYYAFEKTDDAIMELFADRFREMADQRGYSDWEMIENVVSFVQNTTYQEDLNWIGKLEYPKYPIETLLDQAGDCEDTSVLLVSLLHELGYGTVLVQFDNHMGAAIKGSDTIDGYYYMHHGDRYYYIETTDDGWKIGEIDDSLKSRTARLVDPWN